MPLTLAVKYWFTRAGFSTFLNGVLDTYTNVSNLDWIVFTGFFVKV